MSHPIGRRGFLGGAAAVGVGAVLPAWPATGAYAAPIRSAGGFDVIALLDADGPFFITPEEAFPDATPADWAHARRADPGAFAGDGNWHLDFRCFAVRRPGGRYTLVDAGIGPEGSPATWAPLPGKLPEVLAAAGIDRSAVDMVVLTHAHSDHIGWSVSPQGVPMFPNARYVLQRSEVEELVAGGDTVVLPYLIEPLRQTGQLCEIDGRTRLVSGPGGEVTAIPTPGHTMGHQSVIVSGGRTDIVVTGDVLVHAVQLVAPEVGYVFEDDQDVARRTRQALLASARQRHALLATAHLNQPFVSAR